MQTLMELDRNLKLLGCPENERDANSNGAGFEPQMSCLLWIERDVRCVTEFDLTCPRVAIVKTMHLSFLYTPHTT